MYEADLRLPAVAADPRVPPRSLRPVPGGIPGHSAGALLDRGQIALDSVLLRRLRQGRLMSQQDLADECWRRNIRVSIATIKRAEAGRAVRFRVARELARCFSVPVEQLLRPAPQAGSEPEVIPA